MRVGIIGLLHESNTFISKRTTLEHFRQDILLTGQAVHDHFAARPHEIGGFFAGLEQASIEAVPILAARAVPYGPIETATFDQLLSLIESGVASAGTLDGVLVAPHGATVCESIRDADGYWLQQLRKQLGNALPIIGTLDPHANLSQLMVDSTDALIGYRTNPHLDQRERGLDAARLMSRTLRGEIMPTQFAAFPPLAINIERQATAEPHLASLFDLADDGLQRAGVLSNSILLGFPYADVEEMGSAVLVVSDGDRQLAAREAERLADYMWQHRHQFDGNLISIEDALDRAEALDGPVCLLDMGDNVGGGSPADSTHIAHAIRKRKVGRSCICICDPQSVQQAVRARVGSAVDLQVGGKTDKLHGLPYAAKFTVQGIYDGKFTESQVRHGGFTDCDQGASVVVKSMDACGLTILITSLRVPPFSLVQLTSCEIDPTEFHMLVAKGVNAPVAAYAPVCKHLIRVNSPGCTTADMQQLDFVHRRKPMFPFEDI
jgi:microcystin degradation protein MlrC